MESVTCCSYALFCQCPRRPIKFAHTDHRGAGEDELFDRMAPGMAKCAKTLARSEEHTSELQSLMRISYAVVCLKKKKIMRVNIPNRIVCRDFGIEDQAH